MRAIQRGHLRARLAVGPGDVERAQALRHLCFRGVPGLDADDLDARCRHVLIESMATGQILACFRVLGLNDAAALAQSYCARFYDLSCLETTLLPAVEMGRFCIAPGLADPDVLRLAWAAMTRLVDDGGYRLMIGCSSFQGADVVRHGPSLAALLPHALGAGPRVQAVETVRLADLPPPEDARAALAGLPPILRSYLGMGGWISDHAVIDRDLDTLHVFTAVEVAKVPPARARALRALAC
jgi:putative hemolysin